MWKWYFWEIRVERGKRVVYSRAQFDNIFKIPWRAVEGDILALVRARLLQLAGKNAVLPPAWFGSEGLGNKEIFNS